MIKRGVFVAALALAALPSLAGCGSRSPVSRSAASSHAPGSVRLVAGYLVPEDPSGMLALGNGILGEASPVWFQPDDSGRVVFASPTAQQSVAATESAASSHHVALVPSIANYRNDQWDGALIHSLITDPHLRAAHIAAIVGLVTSHGWAGIDIDYESLATEDRAAYSAFSADLAAALHQAHKRLTLTVHAKTAEPGDWSGARAQDWQALGASADEVRVMAYDYSTNDGPPGAIAPVPWVESVLQLAVREVPADKIMLGVPTYGYDWTGDQSADSLQWTDAQALAQTHAAPVRWDAASQSPWFTYNGSHASAHTVWFENARSLQPKLALATRYHVHGVVIWRLGGEDPAIWPMLRQALS